MLAVFPIPIVPYCKRFEKDLAKVDDITIYTFLYPDSVAGFARQIEGGLVLRRQVKAMERSDAERQVPAAARLRHADRENLELGRKYRVTGSTPTLVFANGERVPGAIPAEQAEKLLAQNAK